MRPAFLAGEWTFAGAAFICWRLLLLSLLITPLAALLIHRLGASIKRANRRAMDPATNRVVWQVRTKYPLATGSGLLSTASGLLFNGQPDGNLVAYDISNGDELWRYERRLPDSARLTSKRTMALWGNKIIAATSEAEQDFSWE